ncbi:hypothetical protein F7725_019096 [Dissostichus mawsoni]|uniref:HAT C-terminal dimerisation domain-containing protein n=1 Tax=Dissostichus mawsoni TaxID=36200 RepID=A0A7J5XV70_DISMA|nr:hypothetical protein F7725_019096 [Dissostichus mawsoni]
MYPSDGIAFYMIKRLLEQRWPVTATLSDPEVTKATKHYLDMRADQWSILGDLHHALEPFEQATVFLSGEAYVTVSVMPPLVKGLQKSTQKAFESAPIATFQTAAAAEIASRWKVETTYDEDGKNVCIFTAALDPRFRKLKFLSTDDIVKVKIKLQTLALDARRVRVREEPDSPSGQLDHSRGQKPKSVLDTLLGSDEEEEMEDDDPAHDQREDAVRNEPFQRTKTHSNGGMKMKQSSLPGCCGEILSCCPATSTPSERLFSAAGTIVSKKRASLTKEHVDMLTFLHKTFKRKEKLPQNSEKAKKITAKIAEFIAMDDQPLSVVENVGFRRLMEHLEPRYELPSRHYFTEKALPSFTTSFVATCKLC